MAEAITEQQIEADAGGGNVPEETTAADALAKYVFSPSISVPFHEISLLMRSCKECMHPISPQRN